MPIPDWLAVESDARWYSPPSQKRCWGGSLLSVGLHLGAATIAFLLMLQFPQSASAPQGMAQAIEVELIGEDAFDAISDASGAQSVERTVETPTPEIPLPSEQSLPTERDLPSTAEMPEIPVPSEPMPYPMEVLKHEIAQAEPQPEKPPVQVEAPKKPVQKDQPKPKRETARGQGESGKDAGVTSSPIASRGAAGRGGIGGNASADPSFSAKVMAHLIRYKRIPEAARMQRQQVRVTVTFSFDESGIVTGVALSGSSGNSLFDTETLEMVRRASPFPRIPPDMGQASVSFTAPVVYNIN